MIRFQIGFQSLAIERPDIQAAPMHKQHEYDFAVGPSLENVA